MGLEKFRFRNFSLIKCDKAFPCRIIREPLSTTYHQIDSGIRHHILETLVVVVLMKNICRHQSLLRKNEIKRDHDFRHDHRLNIASKLSITRLIKNHHYHLKKTISWTAAVISLTMKLFQNILTLRVSNEQNSD